MYSRHVSLRGLNSPRRLRFALAFHNVIGTGRSCYRIQMIAAMYHGVHFLRELTRSSLTNEARELTMNQAMSETDVASGEPGEYPKHRTGFAGFLHSGVLN